MRRYLVVSDLHLGDIEDHADGWMAHKGSRYLFDQEFSRLLQEFCAGAGPGDELWLMLNGDILDFDLVTAVPDSPPWPVSRSERRRGLRSTAVKSAWKAERILRDHPVFVRALADFLGAGHRVVYLLGNHDREFHFAEVQQVLRRAIGSAAQKAGLVIDEKLLVFEPWFFYRPGEIYVEHGQQYDYYNSFRDVLCPTVNGREGPMLALPMGNLSNRYLMTQMGYFNPFAADFIMNVFGYLWHWLKHYAFSRRSLLLTWLWGSLVVMGKLLHIKRRQLGQPRTCAENPAEAAEQRRLAPELIAKLAALQEPPITDRVFRVMRELWLDRVALFLLLVGGTIALALVPVPLWLKLMVPLSCFPLLLLLYETLMRSRSIFYIENEAPRVALEIARLLDAPVITFGHDHVPRLLPLGKGVNFVDTGAWAPLVIPGSSGRLTPGLRNYLLLVFGENGLVEQRFGSYLDLAGG